MRKHELQQRLNAHGPRRLIDERMARRGGLGRRTKQGELGLAAEGGSQEPKRPFWVQLLWALGTAILAVLFIYYAHGYTSRDMPHFSHALRSMETARLTELIEEKEGASAFLSEDGRPLGAKQVQKVFKAVLLTGEKQGQEIRANYTRVLLNANDTDQLSVGARVFVSNPADLAAQTNPNSQPANTEQNSYSQGPDSRDALNQGNWVIYQQERLTPIYVLGAVFFLLMLLLGGWKGLGTVASLVYTIAAIFLVLIPAILSAYNIYLWTILILISVVAVTVIFINGGNMKSLTAALGCLSGMALAALIQVLMSQLLQLTGVIDEDANYLTLLHEGRSIDLKALIFATILIGAAGALLDVSVDLVASLREFAQTTEGRSFQRLLRTGFVIGRDIMGTMVTTLILAYVGGSLTALLMTAALNAGSILYLLNSESVIVELLQMLVGALGVLVCIPTTAFFSALFFSRREEAF